MRMKAANAGSLGLIQITLPENSIWRGHANAHRAEAGGNVTIHPRLSLLVSALGLSAGVAATMNATAQNAAPQAVPAEQTAAAATQRNWKPPRFSWGHANLEGTFTSRDMQGIPLQRPDQFGTRQFLTADEFRERQNAGPGGFAAFVTQQSEDASRIELSALDSTETGTRVFGYTSYVIEPQDGKVPAFTEEGRQRQADRGQANGPFFTTEDFSYYDRCISRGVTGSIMPSLYGDAMRIIQSPTEIAISYEMLHDTRVIPLDGRAQASAGVRQYMGSSVGHFEGDTLVVETTNFTDELAVGRMPHSEDLKLTERFTRIDPDMIDYVVTVDDPTNLSGTVDVPPDAHDAARLRGARVLVPRRQHVHSHGAARGAAVSAARRRRTSQRRADTRAPQGPQHGRHRDLRAAFRERGGGNRHARMNRLGSLARYR